MSKVQVKDEQSIYMSGDLLAAALLVKYIVKYIYIDTYIYIHTCIHTYI
jgi:hypothetical protein